MSKRTILISVASALLLAAACESGADSAQPSSSSTNWLVCHTDTDCSAFDPAICSGDGYCVDEQGLPIEQGASSQTSGGNGNAAGNAQTAPDAGVPTSNAGTTTEPSQDASMGAGGSVNDSGGSAGQPSSGASSGDPNQAGAGPTGSAGAPGAGGDLGAGGEPSAGGSDAAGASGASSQQSCAVTGDLCCDPFPGDGANYCDNGLQCFSGYCIDVSDLNTDCVDGACPDGLSPVSYFGIAGPSGPEFCSCSIPCEAEPTLCPSGSTCNTIADGPGTVCVQDESGGSCTADGNTGCSALSASPTPCCDGLVCCEGVPYSPDGECYSQCPLVSDRNLKTNVQAVDPALVLQSVASMPISTWSYRAQPDVQHIGPMAQDFRASFGMGDSDKTIAPVDAIGVALASIQALNQRVEALAEENQLLKRQLEQLESTASESSGQCLTPEGAR